jgi:hypothetical protein
MKSHMMNITRAGAMLLLVSGFLVTERALAAADTRNAVPGEKSVEVAGVRNPEWKPYRSLLLGFEAFESKRALAPKAVLRFAVRPMNPGTSLAGVMIRLESSAGSAPLPLDENYSFALPFDPAGAANGAELLTNRKKDTLAVRPDIRSPGLPPNVRRLGDLRLECHVRWAIQKDELGFMKRNAFRMLGGPCDSGRVATYYFADRPINAARMTAPGRKVALPLAGNGSLYRPPVHDANWDDETLVVMEFAEERAP